MCFFWHVDGGAAVGHIETPMMTQRVPNTFMDQWQAILYYFNDFWCPHDHIWPPLCTQVSPSHPYSRQVIHTRPNAWTPKSTEIIENHDFLSKKWKFRTVSRARRATRGTFTGLELPPRPPTTSWWTSCDPRSRVYPEWSVRVSNKSAKSDRKSPTKLIFHDFRWFWGSDLGRGWSGWTTCQDLCAQFLYGVGHIWSQGHQKSLKYVYYTCPESIKVWGTAEQRARAPQRRLRPNTKKNTQNHRFRIPLKKT